MCKYKRVEYFVFCIFLVPGITLEEADTFLYGRKERVINLVVALLLFLT